MDSHASVSWNAVVMVAPTNGGNTNSIAVARRFLMNWFSNEVRRQRRLHAVSLTELTSDDHDDHAIEFPDRHGLTPEATIEQRRIILVACLVLEHQRNHHAASGNEALFDVLCDALTGTGRIDWDNATPPLLETHHKHTAGSLRITVHRMRKSLQGALVMALGETLLHQTG